MDEEIHAKLAVLGRSQGFRELRDLLIEKRKDEALQMGMTLLRRDLEGDHILARRAYWKAMEDIIGAPLIAAESLTEEQLQERGL